MGSGKKIIKNTLALSVSNFVPRIAQTLLIFYAARHIGDVGLGKYYTLSSLIAIVSLITDFGLNGLVAREIAKDATQTNKYFWNLLMVKILLSALTYGFLIVLVKILGYSSDINQGAYIFGIYMILTTATMFIQSFWQAYEEMHYIGILMSVVSVFNLGVAAWLLIKGEGFMALIWGLLVSGAVGAALHLIFFAKHLRFRIQHLDPSFLKKIFVTAIPFALISIFSTVYFRLDVIFLSKFQTDAVVGWYGSSHKIIEVLQMIPYAFLGAVYPAFSRLYSGNFDEFSLLYRRVSKVLLYLAFPVAIGLTVVSRQAMMFLYGPEFVNGSTSLIILSWALCLMFLNTLFMTTCMAIDKVSYASIVSFIDIVLSIVLNLILIPRGGLNLSLNGAGITVFLCEVFNFFALSLFLRKQIVPLGIAKLSWKPLFAALIMGVLVWMMRRLNLFIAVSSGALVYVAALFILQAIKKEELMYLKKLVMR